MKIIKRFLLLIAAVFFCAAAWAEEVDNPHSASLAAVRAGNLQKLKDLVEKHGANINSRNRPGESLLMMSIKAGHKDIANYLLDKGANVEMLRRGEVMLQRLKMIEYKKPFTDKLEALIDAYAKRIGGRRMEYRN